MKYLSPEDIKNSPDELMALQQHASWDIRSGRALSLVQRYVPDKDGAILDCASASGGFLLQLAKNGYSNVNGLDIDDYRQPEAKKFNFKTGDVCLQPIPWPDHSFDAVVSLQTIEHLENPYYFVREVSRVLKPGGIFTVSMPNPFHILNRLLFLSRGNLYHWLESDNHITFFTKATFKKAFLNNFKLLEMGYSKPEFKYHIFSRLRAFWKILPANQWFGRYTYFVLKNKE
ncbi:MAG: methyltransferase domain-containing protein [bacterium]|nr:methyltransferase domain-containing protein [bacterium]